VAVTKDGLWYVGFREWIEVYDAKGDRQASWKSPAGRPWFTGLTVVGEDVFAADAGNRLVRRYDRAGKLVGRIGAKNKERQVPGLVLPSPYLDVEWHKDGLLRVNNPGRHRVELYTLDGDLELTWGKPSAAIDGFCGCCNPINLALLPDGSCVTCEKGLPRVKVYRPNGEFDCVVAGPETFPENARLGAGPGTGEGLKAGLDVVVDPQERLYVLDYATGTIRVMARKPVPTT
jgi:sugar lactone lactonase YvrE